MANQFLVKETMADMKALSAAEITALQAGTYNGVQLLGYHKKGDIGSSLYYYYVVDPSLVDNGGNIILANGITLFYPLSSEVNVNCFGAKGDGINTTIIIGNGVNSNEQFIAPRISYVELQDLIVTNIGAGCVRVDGCINWRIFNCRICSTGDGVRTIDANYSWRGIIAEAILMPAARTPGRSAA